MRLVSIVTVVVVHTLATSTAALAAELTEIVSGARVTRYAADLLPAFDGGEGTCVDRVEPFDPHNPLHCLFGETSCFGQNNGGVVHTQSCAPWSQRMNSYTKTLAHGTRSQRSLTVRVPDKEVLRTNGDCTLQKRDASFPSEDGELETIAISSAGDCAIEVALTDVFLTRADIERIRQDNPDMISALVDGVFRRPERVQTLTVTAEFGVRPYRLPDGTCHYSISVTGGCMNGGRRTEPKVFPVSCDTTYRAHLPVTIDPYFVGMCLGDARIEARVQGSEVIVGRTTYQEIDARRVD